MKHETKKWIYIGIGALVVAGIIVGIVSLFAGGSSGGTTSDCGGTPYDTSKSTCIDNNTICALTNACYDSKGTLVCVDPNNQQCIGDKVCDNSNACVDSDGNPVCCDAECCGDVCCGSGETCQSGSCVTSSTTCDDGKSCVTGVCCGPKGKTTCCGGSKNCIDDQCISCDQPLCGGRVCCDSSKGESCSSDGTCCVVCGKDKTCCPDGQTCYTMPTGDTVCCTSQDQVCVDTLGNYTCCPNGQTCFDNVCCDTGNQCGDGQCCDNGCCGDGDSSVCCPSGTTCNKGKCMVSCGDNFCDPDTQVCNEADGNKYCTTKGCEWSTIVYDPNNLADNDGADSIPVCGYDGKYYTCLPGGGIDDKLTRTVSDTETSNNLCTMDDCDYRFAEKGLDDAAWNSDSRTCTGTFDCQNALGACGECPVSGDRCCLDADGNYTGQLCPLGSVCDNGECVVGYKCDSGKCVAVNDSSEAQYTTLQDCIDASCYVKGAGCYTKDNTDVAKQKTEPKKYFQIALYGFNGLSDGDYGRLDGTSRGNELLANEDGKFIYQWKCENPGRTAGSFYVYCTAIASGITYYIEVYSGGTERNNCYFTGTPSITKVNICKNSSDKDCNETGNVSDLNYCAISPHLDNDGHDSRISGIIIVPAGSAGPQCNPTDGKGEPICKTLSPGVGTSTPQSTVIQSQFMTSLRAMTPWTGAGVL